MNIFFSFIFFTLAVLLLTGCTKEIYRDVYIPTKCEIVEREKPKRSDYSDYTDFAAHLRAYYANVEADLYFCRTGKFKSVETKQGGE